MPEITRSEGEQEYEDTYATHLAEERASWVKFRRGLNQSEFWKDATPSLRNGMRNSHRVGFCKGRGIPTAYEFLNERNAT